MNLDSKEAIIQSLESLGRAVTSEVEDCIERLESFARIFDNFYNCVHNKMESIPEKEFSGPIAGRTCKIVAETLVIVRNLNSIVQQNIFMGTDNLKKEQLANFGNMVSKRMICFDKTTTEALALSDFEETSISGLLPDLSLYPPGFIFALNVGFIFEDGITFYGANFEEVEEMNFSLKNTVKKLLRPPINKIFGLCFSFKSERIYRAIFVENSIQMVDYGNFKKTTDRFECYELNAKAAAIVPKAAKFCLTGVNSSDGDQPKSREFLFEVLSDIVGQATFRVVGVIQDTVQVILLQNQEPPKRVPEASKSLELISENPGKRLKCLLEWESNKKSQNAPSVPNSPLRRAPETYMPLQILSAGEGKSETLLLENKEKDYVQNEKNVPKKPPRKGKLADKPFITFSEDFLNYDEVETNKDDEAEVEAEAEACADETNHNKNLSSAMNIIDDSIETLKVEDSHHEEDDIVFETGKEMNPFKTSLKTLLTTMETSETKHQDKYPLWKKSMELNIGDKIYIKVTYAHGTHFYGNIIDNIQRLKIAFTTEELFRKCQPVTTLYFPKKHEIVLGKYLPDDTWHRVLVKEIFFEQQAVLGLYVDYGNSATIAFTNLMYCPECIKSWDFQAYRFKFHDLVDEIQTHDAEFQLASELLTELVGKTLIVEVKDFEVSDEMEIVYSTIIVFPQMDHLKDQLINNGFAAKNNACELFAYVEQ